MHCVNSRVLSILVGVPLLIVPIESDASSKVLKLPFADPDVELANGWDYDFSEDDHEGIDYKKGDWEAFEVVAAYSGELSCVPDGTPGYSAYGNTCTIKHVVGQQTFYTLYAHLESYNKEAGYVSQGEQIGTAGNTGTGVIHLHFEIQIDALCMDEFCRRDPYGLYTTRSSYPGYIGYEGLGSDHWWADNPPLPPGEPLENETCYDGIKNQGEVGVDCGGPCPACDPDAPCECESGSCCDGCYHRPAGFVCQNNVESKYSCIGVGCSADVSVQYRDIICSGLSPNCDGGYSEWSDEAPHEICGGNERCVEGMGSCVVDQMCSCTYSLNPESPASSYDAPYTCPGDIVMPISGSINPDTGKLTVSSPSKPGGFGAGTYRVVVFSPFVEASKQCKANNVVKSEKVLNETEQTLIFEEFDSLLECGGDHKAYCIIKEAGGNDAHFCSGRLLATYD